MARYSTAISSTSTNAARCEKLQITVMKPTPLHATPSAMTVFRTRRLASSGPAQSLESM